MESQKQLWQNKLTYIDNYPPNWKYISLFAKIDDQKKEAEVEALRQANMEKILKTVEIKSMLREKEIMEADEQVEKDNHGVKAEKAEENIQKAEI